MAGFRRFPDRSPSQLSRQCAAAKTHDYQIIHKHLRIGGAAGVESPCVCLARAASHSSWKVRILSIVNMNKVNLVT